MQRQVRSSRLGASSNRITHLFTRNLSTFHILIYLLPFLLLTFCSLPFLSPFLLFIHYLIPLTFLPASYPLLFYSLPFLLPFFRITLYPLLITSFLSLSYLPHPFLTLYFSSSFSYYYLSFTSLTLSRITITCIRWWRAVACMCERLVIAAVRVTHPQRKRRTEFLG